jgi:hypothetical protein
MIYFKDASGKVAAYDTQADRERYGAADLVPMTDAEVQAHINPPALPVVPPSVTRFQARAVLHLAGLLPQVETMMADPATPMLARLAWQDAQEFRRTSPTVLAMAQALSLTDAQIDGLFINAATIEA